MKLCDAGSALPHARGGVSACRGNSSYTQNSSPRPWGCFLVDGSDSGSEQLFPTPVGVFPARCSPLSFQEPLPHARGGVSTVGRNNGRENCSSPRPWGCFLKRREIRWLKTLFPTPVGVFLYPYPLLRKCRTLPHARGGVSWRGYVTPESSLSSPRPWGCFRVSGEELLSPSLFPTPVGVFPPYPAPKSSQTPLPHARGGVSAKGENGRR